MTDDSKTEKAAGAAGSVKAPATGFGALTTRRTLLAGAGMTAVGAMAFGQAQPARAAADQGFVATLLSGEPGADAAVLQARIASQLPSLGTSDGVSPGLPGSVMFEIATDSSFAAPRRTDWLAVDAKQDFIARTRIDGLKSDTQYYFRIVFRAAKGRPVTSSEIASFVTLPDAASRDPLSFAVFSCMSYDNFYGLGAERAFFVRGRASTEAERQRGYPTFDLIREAKPRFMVATGDTVYYDHPNASPELWATTVPQMRNKWHRQFAVPSVREALAANATFFMKDDHDFRTDDADNVGTRKPSPEDGRRIHREQVPGQDAKGLPYRTVRLNKYLQIWILEGRDYRSPNATPDGPDKTLWGKTQREWLETTLLASDADFKLIINPTPIIGPDDLRKNDNHASLKGFRYEGERFLQFLKDKDLITSTFIVVGDRHWRYHSVHPTGAEEFASGCIHRQISRLGVKVGDPEGTDPESLIKQPYLQPLPDGGYLQIDIEPDPFGEKASLLFRFWSESGRLQYAARRYGPRQLGRQQQPPAARND